MISKTDSLNGAQGQSATAERYQRLAIECGTENRHPFPRFPKVNVRNGLTFSVSLSTRVGVQ